MTEDEFLQAVKKRLARLYHDLNNPLAIVSGNLQYLHELIRMGETGPDLEASIADATEAVGGFSAPLEDLLALRAEIEEHLGIQGD